MENDLTNSEKEARKHLNAAKEPRYGWVRQVVGLSSASLALLVSLQNAYVSQNTEYRSLLQISWVAYGFAILLGVLTLYGESQTELDLYRTMRRLEAERGHIAGGNELRNHPIQEPRFVFKFAFHSMAGCFVVAITFLVLFASLNLSR